MVSGVNNRVSGPSAPLDLDNFHSVKNFLADLPGGAVVKNPPANTGDTGSIPGPGRSHVPWSN